MNRVVGFLLVAALAIAGCVVAISWMSTPSPTAVVVLHPNPSTAPAGQEPAPLLASVDQVVHHETPPDATDARVATISALHEAADERPPKWQIDSRAVLRGRVVGLEAGVPWRTPVFVVAAKYAASRTARRFHPASPNDPHHELTPIAQDPFEHFASDAQPLNAFPDGAGWFELDLMPLFDGKRGRWLPALDVSADDPSYTAARTRIEIPEAASRQQPLELTAELVVRPSSTVIGVVERSGPPREPSPISVGLFHCVDGVPDEQPVDETAVVDRFHLRAPEAGNYLVVADGPDSLPASELVSIELGQTVELAPLRLPAGVAVNGTLRFVPMDRRIQQLSEHPITVSAELMASSPRKLELGGGELLFDGGRWSSRARTTPVDLFGGYGLAFSIDGLESGRRYRVHVNVSEQVVAAREQHWCEEVVAPADEIQLDFAAAYVGVNVVAASRPLAGARVELGAGGGTADTDRDGRAGFFVPENSSFQVGVSAEGMEPASATVESGPVGTLSRALVQLEPRDAGGRLVVDADCDAFTQVRSLTLAFEPADGGTSFPRTATLENGELRFTSLPFGRFRIRAQSVIGWPRTGTATLKTVAASELVPQTVEIELVPKRETEARLELHRGATLSILAVDFEGQPLRAHCEIRDASGALADVAFVHAGGDQVSSSGRDLLGMEASVTAPGLPGGRYQLTFTLKGFETQVVAVDLVAGNVTDVSVKLLRP